MSMKEATVSTLYDIVGTPQRKTNTSIETSAEYEQILQTSQELKEKYGK